MGRKINRKKMHGGLAIGEIILLITSIVAFSFILGDGFSVVSAEGECVTSSTGKTFTVSEITATIGSGKQYSNLWAWCLAHGGSDVCGGGSGAATSLITHPCPGEEEEAEKEASITSYLSGMVVPSGAAYVAPKIAAALGFGGGGATAGQFGGSVFGSTTTSSSLASQFTLGSGSSGGTGIFKGYVPSATKGAAETATGNTGSKNLIKNLIKGIKKNPLKYAEIVTIAYIVIASAIVFSKTGDIGKAKDVAIRMAVGAGIGFGAAHLTVAIFGIVSGPAGWIISAGLIAGVLLSYLFKKEQDRDITFTCKSWQAQSGGTNCESCNDGTFPCTEYQCKSLGTGCEIINKDTDEPICIWKDPRDVNPPEIQAWEEALTEGYEYVPLPPVEGTGVEIKYIGSDDGCSPAFQPFTFGVDLSKDGYCRIEKNRTASFSNMNYDFGEENLYMKQHTQQMSFPGVVHLEQAGITLTNNGEFEFYVRCEAATNGKANRDEFIFKFCIDKGPDTTSPEIRSFNKPDNTPIAYFKEGETKEIAIQAYVNEPAECKWSHEDKSYENMENNLTCPNSPANINSQSSYTCSGKLTDLENNRENKFFFRCNDTFGNINIQSRTLTLIGTQLLFISSVGPNATTIKGSTENVEVTLEAETSAGYQDGKATCEYSTTGTSGSYMLFQNSESHEHSENIRLSSGEHNYFIRCFDLAGNSDSREISFTVETDTSAPIVVRVFRDGMNLKIITNEEAACVYDNTDCLYDVGEGLEMTTTDNKIHSTTWDSNKNFYIKCQDEFENQPAPQNCNIIARPFEV